MKNFYWKLFWKNILIGIPFVGCIFVIGVWSESFEPRLVLFWCSLIFSVAVLLLIIAMVVLEVKPGIRKPEKLKHIVRPTTVIIVIRTKPISNGILAVIRQPGKTGVRRVLWQKGLRAPENGMYRVGFNYELYPCKPD